MKDFLYALYVIARCDASDDINAVANNVGEPILTDISRYKELFRDKFSCPPDLIVRAPGRAELIGGHTDYNDGFVLPMAIERNAIIVASRRPDKKVRIFSEALGEQIEFVLDGAIMPGDPAWGNYAKGVAALLLRAGKDLCGLDMYLGCDIPIGGGLSSSAAIEVAYAKTFLGAIDDNFDPVELALLCQEAEHSFAGTPCGIMDQFISVLAREGTALLLDCRSRGFRHISMPIDDMIVLIADTRVKHNLGQSEYPLRQQQCQSALNKLKALKPDILALRDVDMDMLNQYADVLSPVEFARARHVVTENQRVLGVSQALEEKDLALAGKLLNESHKSLRDDYQVSCEELDFMAECAQSLEGVYGARMSGGGFGGCVVAFVKRASADDVAESLKESYTKQFNIEPNIFSTLPAGGAEIITQA